MAFLRDKLWALAGLMISALCLLLHLFAFALPEWTIVSRGTVTLRLGLWRYCYIYTGTHVKTCWQTLNSEDIEGMELLFTLQN